MSKVHVTAKRDFLESLTTARPLAALAELVWNGLDAGSDRIQIQLDMNEMGGLQNIRVRDFGDGIERSEIETLFGNLGDSWKKNKGRHHGRALHGKNGKGRFRAFALGTLVEWNTTFKRDGNTYKYTIAGDASALDDFEASDVIEACGIATGTEVVVSNLRHEFQSLANTQTPNELARIFAAYLAEYPGVSLEYDGVLIDPKIVQARHDQYRLGDIPLDSGNKASVDVSIIEWKIPVDRILYLCDASGIALHELQVGQQIRAPGFSFTAYIKSDYFRELDKDNRLLLSEIHPDVEIIVKTAKNKIKEHFRRRLVEHQGGIVERWKKEQIYPYEDRPVLTPVEEAERQVFNILASNVQSYLPTFEDSDAKSKKFTFRLLAQAIRDNPDSVQQIISEILGLKKAEQDDLAELLRNTSLSSIISLAKTVANRLDFLVALETLLFDSENRKNLLERDQLHKILVNEAWLFHEEFSLAGSEQRLEDVLEKHLDKLGRREDDPDSVKLSDGKSGRVDLMLHKATQPRVGEYDYLIVELKRPSKKIDAEVITQVKKYARAVAEDERFHNIPARWTFIAISNDLDAFAKRESTQRNWPKGKVSDDAELNITVWVKPWSEVINDARARLHFVSDQLSYEADRDSARAYLKKTYSKFIPTVDEAADAEPALSQVAQ